MADQSTVATINKGSNDNVVISLKNIYQQIFDFPYDAIKHILANANYNVVKKLYFTCKYFPSKFRLYLIDNLRLRFLKFKRSKILLPTNFFEFFKDRIWLGQHIYISSNLDLSRFASKVEKCTIKIFHCNDTILSWNDFKKLAEARTIEVLKIYDILNTDGQKVPIEDICDYTPNLNDFESMYTHVTPNTIKRINSSLISTNMERFYMKFVDGLLNAKDYLEFIKIRTNADFTVRFDLNVSKRHEFYATVKAEIQTWPEPKPSFY